MISMKEQFKIWMHHVTRLLNTISQNVQSVNKIFSFFNIATVSRANDSAADDQIKKMKTKTISNQTLHKCMIFNILFIFNISYKINHHRKF